MRMAVAVESKGGMLQFFLLSEYMATFLRQRRKGPLQ